MRLKNYNDCCLFLSQLLRLQSTFRPHFELLCSCYVGGFSSGFFFFSQQTLILRSLFPRQTDIYLKMGALSKTKLPEITGSLDGHELGT